LIVDRHSAGGSVFGSADLKLPFLDAAMQELQWPLPWHPPVPNGTEKDITLSAMWKPNQTPSMTPTPTPEPPSRPAQPSPVAEVASRAPVATSEQATIGKGLFIKGEISGTESLFIDGKVEGSINLPGNRVTIGRNGQVSANVTAREVVVLGKVKGNVSATDRVDIRAEGALSGDVAAARISIEDGAFFKGGIDIRKGDAKQVANGAPAATTPPPVAQPAYEQQKLV
jgi:cytoskeletal protein CcmA (bactofilin family)